METTLSKTNTWKATFFFSKLKQYLKEPRDGSIAGFQGIPEPDLESPQELQGIDSTSYFLGGSHDSLCLVQSTVGKGPESWVPLVHLATIVGT